MSNLITSNNQSSELSSIIQDLKSPMIKDLIESNEGQISIKKAFVNIIERADIISGTKQFKTLSDNEILTRIEAFLSVLKRNKWIRINEIQKVIENGLLGEYGEFTLLTATNLNLWIRQYRSSEKRVKALKELSSGYVSPPLDKEKLSAEHKKLMIETLKGILHFWPNYKASAPSPAQLYDYIIENKICSEPSKELRLKFYRASLRKFPAAHIPTMKKGQYKMEFSNEKAIIEAKKKAFEHLIRENLNELCEKFKVKNIYS